LKPAQAGLVHYCVSPRKNVIAFIYLSFYCNLAGM
jgi:hypothetical protein